MCYTQNFQQMSSGKLFDRLKWKLLFSFTDCTCSQLLQCAARKCDTHRTHTEPAAELPKALRRAFLLVFPSAKT